MSSYREGISLVIRSLQTKQLENKEVAVFIIKAENYIKLILQLTITFGLKM
jgi:hypothetical protein